MSEETKTNEPVKQEGDLKLKQKRKTPKKLSAPEETIKMDFAAVAKKEELVKVDLSKVKKEEDAIQKQETESSVLREERSSCGS